MINIKKIYEAPRQRAWLSLKRSGHRAELYHYYEPKMEFIRELHELKDYAMLRICLKELKDKSLYYAKHGMGFAVTAELFEILIDLLEFQGRHEYANILIEKTNAEMMIPIVMRKELNCEG